MSSDLAAADGSPVELYARLPTFGEPELVHKAIPPEAQILELGCGAGRMTHGLVALGHPVTAVDSSAAMLAHVRGAETVHASIEELDLRRTFGCVLLASQLVNVDDEVQRASFLAACARHVAADGVVIIQRYDPEWAADPRPSESVRDGVTMRVLDPSRDRERLSATIEYELGGHTWRHGPFTSRILDDNELTDRLGIGGLHADHWLDARRTWLAATLAPDVTALYVEIPAAEPVVAEARRRWDAAGIAVPAHVTILFPFVPPASVGIREEQAIATIADGVDAFDVRFERVGRFPDVVWLAPEPVEPFARLTEELEARWPDYPPYGGAFEQVVHHLTVADGAPIHVLDELESTMRDSLPLVQRVSALTLSVRERGSWTVRRRYPFRGGIS